MATQAEQSAVFTPTKPSEQTIQPTRVDQIDMNSLPISLGGGNVKWVNLFNSFARDGDLLTGDIIGFWEGSINNKERFEQLLDLDSTCKCNKVLKEYLKRRHEIKALPWAVVQFIIDLC